MKRKIVFAVILTILMCIVSSEYATAATGLSVGEQSILDKLKTGIEIKGKVEHIPVTYINMVENEFIKNETDITPEQAAAIIGKLDEAIDIVKTAGLKDVADIKTSTEALRIMKLADEAAGIVHYSLSINLSDMSLNITDPEGNSILVSKSGINQTGFDLTSALIVGLVLIIILIACAVTVIKLKNFMTSDYANKLFDDNKNDKGTESSHEE
ncbi:MAG TPA: hypothetical protein VN131_07320 [Mobilitalea sp.]|nr:hypothetical protein [Mobilitalea sp.]